MKTDVSPDEEFEAFEEGELYRRKDGIMISRYVPRTCLVLKVVGRRCVEEDIFDCLVLDATGRVRNFGLRLHARRKVS